MTTKYALLDRTVEALPMIESIINEPAPAGELLLAPSRSLTPAQATMLNKRAVATVSDARKYADVEIEYLGIAPMFAQPRWYEAEPHDWVMTPVVRKEEFVVPRAEQAVLRRLTEADIDFGTMYVAHEVLKTDTAGIPKSQTTVHTDLTAAQADQLIGPPPAPPQAVEVGERLARRTTQVFDGLRKTAVAGGAAAAAVVAAPVVLAGAALAGMAQMDPIIIGAMPLGEPREGQAAAWFVLARWDW